MPNWVTNFIELEGDEKRIAEMKESIKKDDFGLGTIDFNKLIPMPKELDIVAGSSTDKGLKAYSLFAEIYQLGTKRTKEELLNIPEKSEQAFLKYKKDIKPEDWELGRQAYPFTVTVDGTAPTLILNGVENGNFTTGKVNLTDLSETAEVKVYYLNELVDYNLGDELKDVGNYKVVVTDECGNQTIYEFEIQKEFHWWIVVVVIAIATVIFVWEIICILKKKVDD